MQVDRNITRRNATGNQVYVADPQSSGDDSRFLQLAGNGMTPYVSPNLPPGVSFDSPLATPLGLAIPLSALASSYSDAVAGRAGTSLFPASALYSWPGQLYDTMYVVDRLRFWVQCAACQYGYSTTLSPPPSANVEAGYRIYFLANGMATDSIGSLGSNGLLVTQSIPPATQRSLGIPFLSAVAAGATTGTGRWLDWHQFTIANLQGTVTLPTGGALVGDPDTLQVSFKPDLLPADVAYQWTFGDASPTVTVQNNGRAIHSYASAGTFPITVKVVDNRNDQVIARADTTLNGANVELWKITSLTYLYTVVDGARSDTSPALVFDILPNTVPTLIALNGPPFPGGDYDGAGLAFASPPDSAQQWKQATPIGLALAGPHTPIDVFAYSNTGTATSGTITGKAIQSTIGSGGLTNAGFSVNLAKNGTMLSGYIMKQGTAALHGDASSQTTVLVDSIIAVRVP